MVMGALGVTGKSPVTTSISNNNGNGGGGNGGGGNREQVNVNRIIKIILSLVEIRSFRTYKANVSLCVHVHFTCIVYLRSIAATILLRL